jgi:sugar phosphate isomerase/epimerase
MQVGMLTVPFHNEPLEQVINWAAEAGFDCLEVYSAPKTGHINPETFRAAHVRAVCKRLGAAGVAVSSLAWYTNMTPAADDERKATVKTMKRLVDIAADMGVGVVCTSAGMPLPGKDRMQTIESEARKSFPPLLAHAAKKGIKIALENWAATNIQNLAHWQRLFELVPDDNFGLNFDPSHLVWQGIDYLHAVEFFARRIFHTHAKDTEVVQHKVRWIGNQGSGWWRYVIPGYGDIDWGVYIARLRQNGYNGVLSIEHEDGALGREEGFIKGLQHLRQFA